MYLHIFFLFIIRQVCQNLFTFLYFRLKFKFFTFIWLRFRVLTHNYLFRNLFWTLSLTLINHFSFLFFFFSLSFTSFMKMSLILLWFKVCKCNKNIAMSYQGQPHLLVASILISQNIIDGFKQISNSISVILASVHFLH